MQKLEKHSVTQSMIMKMRLGLLTIVLVSSCIAAAQTKYNQSLADSLGADNYGMKAYVLVMLKTGSNMDTTKTTTDSLFKGHMDNMSVMVKKDSLL